MNQRCDKIIRLAADVAQRYGISSLDPLLTSCRAVADQSDLGVAVIGRFKAGKSSFLNHLFGRNLLPVGAVPVTTIITRVCCGPTEKATVDFLDGRTEEIAVGDIRRFIAESENPENIRRVSKLTVELPALARLKGLCFIDTPGLESSLAHNTEASLQWLPNVELAIVAVSADTPLSRRDIDLLKSLSRHTPEISILLTKVDLVDESELDEILSFIRQQLERVFNPAPPIFPYSVRPGFEHLRAEIEDRLTGGALANFQHQRRAIIERKLETLAGECIDYLNLALVSAEMIESEREALRKQVVGEKEFVDDAKSEMRLLIRHEAGGARSAIASLLQTHRAEIETRLLEELKAEFTGWTKSLRHSLESFEDWLQSSLSEKLAAISRAEYARMIAPLKKAERRLSRTLQNFRDQLSARTLRAFGVPLRTTEVDIEVEEPRAPDVHIGSVFDHSWELLSSITPMRLIKRVVQRHFAGKVPYMVEKNLSRLTSQWEASIHRAMRQAGREAERQVDELMETIDRLIKSSPENARQIRLDIERLVSARNEKAETSPREAVG